MSRITSNSAGGNSTVSGTVTANAGTGTFIVDGSASTQPISAASLPLPAGAATSALQTTGNTALTTINTTLGSPFQVGGSIGNTTFASTQSGTWNINNISGTISLPTGASTSALQTTGNTSLSNIDTKLSTINTTLGSPFQAGGSIGNTTFASTQSGTWNITNVSGTVSLPTGAATSALQTTGNTALSTINTTLGSPFQAGGSIGNTSFIATQATGTNLHTVVDSGTITAVTAITNALPAGSNIIGKVGIDQTTPGTTNLVAAGQNGTWTVQPGNTANTTPWYVKQPDGANQTVTQAITGASQSLIVNTNGASQLTFAATGTWAGLIAAYGSVDGSVYQNIPLYSWSDFSMQTFSGDNNIYSVNIGGFKTCKILQVTLDSGSLTINAWLDVGNGPTMATSYNPAAFKTYSYTRDGSGTAITSTSSAMDVNIKSGTGLVGQKAMAASLPVVLASDQTGINTFLDKSTTGTLSATGSVTLSTNGCSSAIIQITGTYVATAMVEGTNDGGTTWNQLTVLSESTGALITVIASNANVTVECASWAQIRLRIFAYTSGTMNIAMSASSGTRYLPVVSATASTFLATATQGSANTVSAAWPIKITDATNTAIVKAASTAAAATDAALVVSISPNSTATISGSVTGYGTASATNANSSAASTVLTASLLIKNAPGRLYSLTGVNTKATAQYILVFNTTSVPADTTIPVLIAYVPAGAVFSWDFGLIGRYFATGMAASNSSTAATKTIGSADCWFNAEYV